MEKKKQENESISNNKEIHENKYNSRGYVVGIFILLIIIIGLAIYVLTNYNSDNNTNNVISTESETTENEPQKPSTSNPNAVAIAYDTYNEENVLYNGLSLGDDVAYSIDYGAEFPTTDSMTFREYLSDQGLAVLVNGYPNRTPEEMECANQDEAYIATQMAIWEVMNRTGESKKATKIFRVENVEPIAGKEDACNRIVNAAEKLVDKAENDPYTDVPTLTINNSDVSIAKYIEDNALIGPYIVSVTGVEESKVNYIRATLNNAPESAMITDENGNEKTFLSSGDAVYVKLNTAEEDKSFNVKFETSVDRTVGVIYEEMNKETQDYLKLGTVPNHMEQELTINWSKITTLGKIQLTVVDNTNTPIVGAKFKLKDNEGNELGEMETGTDGMINFYSVPEGEYTLEQVYVPDGYEISDPSKNLVAIGGETLKFTFVDRKIE